MSWHCPNDPFDAATRLPIRFGQGLSCKIMRIRISSLGALAGRLPSGSLLVAPLILYLLIFYAYPVLLMLQHSSYQNGWTLQVFAKLLQDGIFWRVMQITGSISLIVTVACLLLAYPVALFLARRSKSVANLMIILVLIPFWTSILVRTYAWMVLLGRRGIINDFLVATGLIERPLQLLNTRLAVCVAMVHVLLPFMVLPIYSTLKSLDWRLIRAAEGLGARPAAVFRQVLLPLSLPGISAGCILVFTLAIGFYITPALVGGPADLMISILISNEVNILDWSQAAAMAVVLLAVVLAIFAGFTRIMGIEKIFQGQR
jgi:putative spermidine/putrescine transport system permease protein